MKLILKSWHMPAQCWAQACKVSVWSVGMDAWIVGVKVARIVSIIGNANESHQVFLLLWSPPASSLASSLVSLVESVCLWLQLQYAHLQSIRWRSNHIKNWIYVLKLLSTFWLLVSILEIFLWTKMLMTWITPIVDWEN